MQQSEGAFGSLSVQLSGTSYLQTETCKQVQSSLQVTMSIPTSSSSYSLAVTLTSTLTSDST
jgi:hypothetical protein